MQSQSDRDDAGHDLVQRFRLRPDTVVISRDAVHSMCRTVYRSTLLSPQTHPHTPQVCPVATTSAILCHARAPAQAGWARPVWGNWMQQLKIELQSTSGCPRLLSLTDRCSLLRTLTVCAARLACWASWPSILRAGPDGPQKIKEKWKDTQVFPGGPLANPTSRKGGWVLKGRSSPVGPRTGDAEARSTQAIGRRRGGL